MVPRPRSSSEEKPTARSIIAVISFFKDCDATEATDCNKKLQFTLAVVWSLQSAGPSSGLERLGNGWPSYPHAAWNSVDGVCSSHVKWKPAAQRRFVMPAFSSIPISPTSDLEH